MINWQTTNPDCRVFGRQIYTRDPVVQRQNSASSGRWALPVPAAGRPARRGFFVDSRWGSTYRRTLRRSRRRPTTDDTAGACCRQTDWDGQARTVYVAPRRSSERPWRECRAAPHGDHSYRRRTAVDDPRTATCRYEQVSEVSASSATRWIVACTVCCWRLLPRLTTRLQAASTVSSVYQSTTNTTARTDSQNHIKRFTIVRNDRNKSQSLYTYILCALQNNRARNYASVHHELLIGGRHG